MSIPSETATDYDHVEVMRKDSAVIVAIHCADQYAAMLLYDSMSAKLNDGFLEIELEVKSKT